MRAVRIKFDESIGWRGANVDGDARHSVGATMQSKCTAANPRVELTESMTNCGMLGIPNYS